MKILSFLIIFIIFSSVFCFKVPTVVDTVYNTLKQRIIKKAIFDGSARLMGFRNAGHAATLMKGRVHAVEKLTALSETFKDEVEVLSDAMNEQTEHVIDLLTRQIENSAEFHNAFGKIERYIPIIETSYNQMMRFRIFNKAHLTREVLKFAENAVDTKEKSIYDAINKLTTYLGGSEMISKQLPRNDLSSITEYLEAKSDVTECQMVTATIETLHTFVQSMILVIMKGKAVIKYGYNIKHLQRANETSLKDDTHLYKTELESLELMIMKSLERILLNFMQNTAHLHRFSYNCRPREGYKEGYNYERFTNFLSTYFADERFLYHPYRRWSSEFFACSQTCEEYDISSKSDHQLRYCKGPLRKCKKFEQNMRLCAVYGKNTTKLFSKDVDSCPKTDIFDTKSQLTADFFYCDTCYCRCDAQIGLNFVYTGPVMAPKGHVVTGVQLRKTNATIYMSILTGKPMPMGFVDIQKAKWFEISSDVDPMKNRDRYMRMTSWCKTFVLADVELERYHVVTGVQFVVNPRNCMINLKVYGSMINILYGILIPNSTVTAMAKPSARKIYKVSVENLLSGIDEKRDIIQSGKPKPKFITFTTTSVHEDLGQTTIPFFDTQPLQSPVSVVQSGVGLYHRSTKNFAGFIAPRLIAFNFTDYFVDIQLIQKLDTDLSGKNIKTRV
ncbi:uncharacterized protein LOC134837250 [Culicoides brevitarsis]|uniref:uncharacterized protein LOC134837250 n=1 Tax=Culicoides brevitarsis TaxID=469753 RepID=UPI00307BD4FF